MARDSNGNYSLPDGYFAITGQTILASQHNPPLEDIAAALTGSIARNGAGAMAANLNMGGFRLTNLGTGTGPADAITKAQLDAIVTALTIPTGEVAAFARSTAPTSWIKANGGTIGNAASGATTRANADTEALFTLLWTEFSNTILPIQTSTGTASTRGASAAADFAANKRLPVFDLRGEFIRGWDNGRGVDTSRVNGSFQADSVGPHTHGAGTLATGPAGGHAHNNGTLHTVAPNANATAGSSSLQGTGAAATINVTTSAVGDHIHPMTGSTAANSGTETRPRNVALLYCIKL